jgi:hypothetical protein
MSETDLRALAPVPERDAFVTSVIKTTGAAICDFFELRALLWMQAEEEESAARREAGRSTTACNPH